MQWSPPRTSEPALANHRAPSAAVTSHLWYRAPLSTGRLGAHHVPMIGEHFADALGETDWPDGACLVLCGRDALFFSPLAIAMVPHLIVACCAEPSPPPDRACATLVVGRQRDLELLPHDVH